MVPPPPRIARFGQLTARKIGSTGVAAGLGGAGRLFAAARAAARRSGVVAATAGEQAPTATTGGRSGRTAGGLSSATGGLAGTAGRFRSGTTRLGGAAGRLSGTGRRTVAGGLTATTPARGRGGVGDRQADGDGTENGKHHGNTLHEIHLRRKEARPQGNSAGKPEPCRGLQTICSPSTPWHPSGPGPDLRSRKTGSGEIPGKQASFGGPGPFEAARAATAISPRRRRKSSAGGNVIRPGGGQPARHRRRTPQFCRPFAAPRHLRRR
jgi:hypothetical protein